MKNLSILSKSIKTALFAGAVGGLSMQALAAEANDIASVQKIAAEQSTDGGALVEDDEDEERIVVTGSRIRRSEFDSASPVQVISGDISREMGLFDATEMLQNTNQAAGSQIDNSFGGFVLDNGPGSATIGFRGLGAERTLVLINGRRMAPAGVGGAPTSADLNLIPAVMIERVENLYDGASTVYGSDAVAGVANVILRQDVEGFELQGSINRPKGGGGEEAVLSGMWGKTTDNGFIMVGAEYYDRKAQSLAQNAFTKGCEEKIWETEEGDIIKRNSGTGPTVNGEDSCDYFPLTNRMFIRNGFWGSVYSTPGYTNTGIPGWSETTVPSQFAGLFPSWVPADFNGDGVIDLDGADGVIVDGNGDGLRDVDFQDPRYALQQSDYYRSGDYLSQNKRLSLIANGEYNFQDENDTKVYFDAMYATRESDIFSPGGQIFEDVPANNPFNPCNPNGVNGLDCFGVLGFGNAGPLEVLPIINIRGDRDQSRVDVSQYRLVTGVTGDLGGFADIGLNNWYYDAYVSYSGSSGEYILQGIDEQRLLHSLNTSVLNDDGSVTCGDGTDGCVPVNLFADNIYQVGGGTLSQAEQDYLFTDRISDTEVTQLVFNGFMGGDLFVLPWNNNVVSGIFGMEYRRDEIKSKNNAVATEGGLWGFSSDGGANGARNLKEVFTEIEMPLVSGVDWVEEFTFTASGRISDESFYAPARTYSLKAVYRPVEWLTLRGTKGTSYRAPNLRERFLAGTTGFATESDPCVVPNGARDSDALDPSAPDSYNAANDTRSAATLDACRADGLDPTALGLGQNGTDKFTPSTSIEVVSGGSLALSEETSVAKTFGFVFEQPFSDEFDLTFSITRFDIEVTNSIAEPSAAYSLDQCYAASGERVEGFCSRISRDANGQINFVDQSFINVGQLTSKGMDYNLYFQKDLLIGDENVDVSLDLQATRMTESLYDVLGTVDDNAGEPDYPEWRASAQLSIKYDDFRFNWATQFIGQGREDWLDGSSGEFLADTDGCTGLLNSAGEPLKCREVGFTEDYFVHNVSLTYTADDWAVAVGIRNVFNEEPPQVDPDGSFSSANIPLGVGYDPFGRTPFMNFSMTF